MEKMKQSQVLEILDYWKKTEFLGQVDIPEEKSENKKVIEKIKKGEKVRESKVEIFSQLTTPYVQIDEKIRADADDYINFPSVGAEVFFSVGKVERNSLVEYLEKYIDNPGESPEIAYPRKSAVAWCSFKTDTDGFYLQGSFQLSPILWAISVWEKNRAAREGDFLLNTHEYDEIVEQMDQKLQTKNVSQFLAAVYEKVYQEWVKKSIGKFDKDSMGFFEYNRYADEEKRDKDEAPNDYADLGKSFFLDDINLLMKLIESGNFGGQSAYEEKVISYILAGYEKTMGMGNLVRTIISPGEPASHMRRFFEEILHVDRAPLGKWPARFMPALMQQVAVNIAIDRNGQTPVFSVNGPPGTGKTTLLKEIVASNIVDRAKLLAENGTDPDTLFEKRSFRQGPLEAYGKAYFQFAPNYYVIKDDRINNYGMLVASCNNAAVENITIDLPKGKDILESLEASKNEDEAVKRGLDEVRDLFDVDQSGDIETITLYGKERIEKDIFFTRYANKLLGTEDCWGLISAPFGKRSNIKKYCNAVLAPFLEEYKSKDARALHRKRYVKQREIFLKQYELVTRLREELGQLCSAGKMVPTELQGLPMEELSKLLYELEGEKQRFTDKIRVEQLEVMQLEESRPRVSLFWKKDTSTRDGLIAEHRETIERMKDSLADVDQKLAEIQCLQRYYSLLGRYSAGEKNLAPLDKDFMEKYGSGEEEQATKAQVTNPWFTAQYNREREKLFLYACKLHKEFVISSKCMRHNIINLMIAWGLYSECGERMQEADRKEAVPYLLQTIFLLTPVISTTFASAQLFLGDIEKSGVLGTLIVDEAGQAPPQTVLGAMFRCRKAVIVGDPKQIEPVVTAEADIIKQLLTSRILAGYKDKKASVQGFADYINPYGTFLGEEEEKEWVGCPLVVHRRCIDPMYSISNRLSYDGTMKQQTAPPKEDRAAAFLLEKSCWIDVHGSENAGLKDHFVKAQGEVVLKLLEKKFQKDKSEIPRLFIITPFTSVKAGIIDMIKKSAFYRKEPRVEKWLGDNNIGTVHTFQGQGTDEVIFLLGCDKKSTGAANWVNKNIVNVAVTRAKFRLYLIGDETVWMCKPVKVARECIANTISAEELDRILSDSDTEEKKVEKKTVSSEKADMQQKTCPKCGKILVERKGMYGKFWGCSGYPGCKYTQSFGDRTKAAK